VTGGSHGSAAGFAPTTSHWGAFGVRADPDGGIEVRAHPGDPSPSPLLGNVAGGLRHASQLHRLLNLLGGYTSSRGSYSHGTSQVLLPYLVGDAGSVLAGASSWTTITENTDLIVAFGGIPAKNVSVTPGGVTRHATPGHLAALAARGVRVALVSPLRGDLPADLDTRWYPLAPATDTALMLGLAHTLAAEGLHDREFLDRYCTGQETFERYLTGAADGVVKDAAWAAAICGIEAEQIRDLARQMAAARTLITVTWSLQRIQHGEQPARGGAGAGRDARPDRPAGRRLRARLRLDGISDGDVVRVFNDRGACLAGAVLTDTIRRGVARLPTGAWFDPVPGADQTGPVLCAHGNPNVLTADVPSSRLSQGSTGQHALVEVQRHVGEPLPVTVGAPPLVLPRDSAARRAAPPCRAAGPHP
jgi:anaerobic selenocysteine-containing dehydrogenase